MADQNDDINRKLRTLKRYTRVSKRTNGIPVYDPMEPMKITPEEVFKKQDEGLLTEEEIVRGVYLIRDEKDKFLGRFYYPNENAHIANIQNITDDYARSLLRDMEVRVRSIEDMFFPTKYINRSKRVEERLNHSKLGKMLDDIGDYSILEMVWPKLLQLAIDIVNPYEDENLE